MTRTIYVPDGSPPTGSVKADGDKTASPTDRTSRTVVAGTVLIVGQALTADHCRNHQQQCRKCIIPNSHKLTVLKMQSYYFYFYK